APRPGLQDLLLEAPVHLLDALPERRLDVGAFLDASRHGLFPVADDVLVRPLVLALFLLAHAPGRARVPSSGSLPFAAAERVVDRIHRDAAHRRPDPEPAAPAGLAEGDVLVVQVADLADGRLADLVHPANLAGRQLDLHPAGVLGEELRRAAGAPHQLPAPPRLQLDVVDRRAERDALQGQGVPDQDVRGRAVDDRLADRQAARGDDVALLAVGVMDERDARRPVRVVLDGRDLARDLLLVSPEVDDPVGLLVAAPPVPDGEPADVVPAAGALLAAGQRLERSLRGDVVKRRHRHEAAAGRGRAE